ncbi:hypothetical protein FACS1894167_03090 [Synergistales bacterium]|nr:hypothetical protein FACS1894167_03090 [Synergistales bacterium]
MSVGTFLPEDVTVLLSDITGQIEPLPTKERERRIQSGVHYSEMLPLEDKPSERYLQEYRRALEEFSQDTANAVMAVSEKIYAEKGPDVALVSLARSGTPVGVLVKRYLKRKYGIDISHYTISIVRGRGIDKVAARYILSRHSRESIQFVDGWTGKGTILRELRAAMAEFGGAINERKLLAVLADPANVTDMRGTHADIPIASSFLNSTVCGLMSRTVIRPGIGAEEMHGVSVYSELSGGDRTYEFIDRIENCIDICMDIMDVTDITNERGLDEVMKIAGEFGVADINFIKPGIGEATRVLLRRVPDMVLVAEGAEPRYIAHLVQLAKEKRVPTVTYPLKRYKACGIIKSLGADL